MKKLMIILTALMLSAFPMHAFIPDGDDGEDPEEIELQNQQGGNGEIPTSINQTHVSAFKTSNFLTIYISGYSGNVAVSIIGPSSHIILGNNLVNGSRILVIDISSLASGDYLIFIQANSLYYGSFLK